MFFYKSVDVNIFSYNRYLRIALVYEEEPYQNRISNNGL